MTNNISLKELRFLLEEAEEEIGRKSEKILYELYWKIGFLLRDCTEEKLKLVSKELSVVFQVEPEMFTTAHRFYKENPIKKKIQLEKR